MAASKSLLAALVLATLMIIAVAQPPTPAPVLLGSAGEFAILSKAGISTVPASAITGDIGVSPIAADAITGFSLIADASNTFSTSDQVTGKCYAADYSSPTPSKMTTAISDMETAYTDAAGRAISDSANLNVKAGRIAGETFKEGVYNWGSNIDFDKDIYLEGNSDSLFLFQTTGDVVVGTGAKIVLLADSSGNGMISPANIVWQVRP
jgi:hypothetical protein